MDKYISNEGLAILILGAIAIISAMSGDVATVGTIAAGVVGYIGGAKAGK